MPLRPDDLKVSQLLKPQPDLLCLNIMQSVQHFVSRRYAKTDDMFEMFNMLDAGIKLRVAGFGCSQHLNPALCSKAAYTAVLGVRKTILQGHASDVLGLGKIWRNLLLLSFIENSATSALQIQYYMP